jgi:tetratricopeptide (TPR) repeat protein
MTLVLLPGPATGEQEGGITVEKLIDEKRLAEARRLLEDEVRRGGETARSLFLEAMILHKEGKYQESNAVLERSLRRDPDSANGWKLAGLNLVSLGREELAEPYFARAVEVAPSDFMARYYLGMALVTRHRFGEGEAQLKESLRLNPAHVDTWCVLGLSKEQQGKQEEALRLYRAGVEVALKTNGRAEKPSLALGRYLVTLRRFDEAEAALREAVEAQNPEALTLLGRALAETGKEEEAVEALERAVQKDAKQKAAYLHLTRLYRKLGRLEEAQRAERAFRELEKQ